MAQPSVAAYFSTRKRSAVDEANIARAKKVLILDPPENEKGTKFNGYSQPVKGECAGEQVQACNIIYTDSIKKLKSDSTKEFPQRNRLVTRLNFDSVKPTNMAIKKETPKQRTKKLKEIRNQPDIQTVLQNLQEKRAQPQINIVQKQNETSPVKNAMDNVSKPADLSVADIKNKLTRSSRLAELKASLARFNKSADKLKQIEKKTDKIVPQSPVLQTFKSIELEVQLSPKKTHTPEKLYLSPRKDSSPRKNLFGLLSPTKTQSLSPVKVAAYQKFQTLASPGKPTLTLPFKYRSLAEMFRSIDTVCSMMFNRKETITFNKIKPAVQEMMRRNLTENHFAQIKSVYPEAFALKYEKMRLYGTKTEKYQLVIVPHVEAEQLMNPTCLLERRRFLFNALIDKVKDYHQEFLASLTPPMLIPKHKITRWHPEFDIEKIPDVEHAEIPQPPEEEKMTTGQEVLEKARELFKCNTRMERALEKLKEIKETKSEETQTKPEPQAPTSLLKGIPKALLEKVRAKQAAKALEAMTRSSTQDKDALMHSRLPDIARLLRNTYVAEKKGVLPLEELIIKLNNSYRSFLTNSEIEEHLRLLCKAVPGWIMFHEIRGTLFVKVSRDGDMSRVMAKLETLAKELRS